MIQNKKTIIISAIAVILFIITIAAASFAYYTSNFSIVGEEQDGNLSGTSAKISSSFDDGERINITNMIPGDSFTKTFHLGNTGTDVNYKIVINDLVNEFESYEDIIYELKENDIVIKEGIFPKEMTDNELSDVLTIRNEERKTYKITITYKNTEEDQALDMGKTISGIFYIKQI